MVVTLIGCWLPLGGYTRHVQADGEERDVIAFELLGKHPILLDVI
jgi:hypothetical protein